MIYKYNIIHNNLYLYLNTDNDNELRNICSNYLTSNNINYNGDKIYLIINDIVVKVIKKDF